MSNLQSEVSAAVEALFRRLPSLVGFSIGQQERELVIADVETDPWPAHSPELFGEIAGALLELVEEKPDARELLLGRTFARTLH
jgi:hypothetical protein